MHDSLPNSVCEECENNINKLYNFRKVIQNSDLELKKHLQASENAKLVTTNFTQLQTEIEHDIKIEVHDHFIDYVKTENDKSEKPKQFSQSMLDNLLYTNKVFNRTSKIETLAAPLIQSALILYNKPDSKHEQTEISNVLQKHHYFCQECNFVCEGHEAWKNHQQTCLSLFETRNSCDNAVMQEKINQHTQNNSHIYICKEYGERFNGYENLRTLEQEGSNCVKFSCEICGEVLSHSEALKQHVIELHCEYFLYFWIGKTGLA